MKIFVVVLVDYMKRKNDRATQEALTLYVKIFVIVFIDYMKNENNKSDEKIVKMIRIGKVCLTLSRDEQDDMEYELEATENGNIKEEICSLSQKHIQEFIDKSEVGPMHLIDLLESWGETGSRMAGLIKSQVA